MAIDMNLVRHALTVARNADLTSVEIESPNLSFSAELRRVARPAVSSAAPATPPSPKSVVKSPLVGYFGHLAKPIKVGSEIALGDVVGVITALGIPNDIVADVAGVVDEVLVAEGDPVQYGQPVLRVKI